MTEYQQKAAGYNSQINELKMYRDEAITRANDAIAEKRKLLRQAKQAMPQDTATINRLNYEIKEQQQRIEKLKIYYADEIDKVKHGEGEEDIIKGRRDDRIEAQQSGFEKFDTEGAAKEAYNAAKSTHTSNLSPSFYRDIAAAMTNRKPGNVFSDSANTQKAQAKNQQNEASNRQMEAQKSQQIADRNEYTEAGKVASMQNDAQNRQNIANREGIAGSAAALMRQTNTPDVAAERQRQDQQRNIANNRRELSDAAQQGATESQGFAEEFGHKSDEYNNLYDISQDAARGVTLGYGNKGQNTGTQDTNTSTQDTNTDTQNTDTSTQSTDTQTPENMETRPEGTVQEPQNTDTSTQDTSTQDTGTDTQDTGTQEPQEPSYNNPDLKAEIDAAVQKAKQIYPEDTSQQINYVENSVGWNKYRISREERTYWQDKYLKDQVNEVQSDCRLKDFKGMLARHKKAVSDARMKIIRHDFDTYGRPDPSDFEWLLNELAKQENAADYGVNYDGDDNTVLKGYADNIRNYVYNYKPEAQAISPDNDPNVTHIGPMAQDIEKVNPACVSKDANGIESVDTGRMAMMNAGAIGDLARSLEDIKERLSRLEARNV